MRPYAHDIFRPSCDPCFRNLAGAGGGLVASIATCPLYVIKTKLQAQQVKTGHHGYLGVAGEDL